MPDVRREEAGQLQTKNPRTACIPPVGHASPSAASSRGVPEGGVEALRSGAWRARWCDSGKRRPTLKRKSGKKAGGENTKRTKIRRQRSYVRGEGAALLKKSFSCRFHLSFFSSSFPLSRFVSSSLPGESYARGNCASMMVGLKRPSLARLSLFDRVISSFSRFFFVSCLSVSLCISLVLCPFPLLRMRVFFPLSCSTALRCSSFFFWGREASFLVFPRASSLDFTSRCFVRALSLSLCVRLVFNGVLLIFFCSPLHFVVYFIHTFSQLAFFLSP